MRSLWYLLFFSFILSNCQSKNPEQPDFIGLWKINLIKRPKGNMKPIARWIQFEEGSAEGRYAWGTGQYNVADSGKWVLNPETKIVGLHSDNGIDHDSEWTIETTGDSTTMVGTDTKVNSNGLTMQLVKTTKRPEHYGDKILSKWKFLRILEDTIPQANPPTWQIEFNQDGSVITGKDTGYWKMNDFAPILTIQSSGNQVNEWFVFMAEDTMVWKGMSTYKGQERYEVHLGKID